MPYPVAQRKLQTAIAQASAAAIAATLGMQAPGVRLLAAGGSDPRRSTIVKMMILGILPTDWFATDTETSQ